MHECGCPEYLRKVEGVLKAEKERVKNYLDISTEGPILKLVDECYLIRHAKQIIIMPGSGLEKMIENLQIPDIKRFYELFTRS